MKNVIAYLKSLNTVKLTLYLEVLVLTKLILALPVTNMISKRSFSAIQILKTWLRSTIKQTKLVHGSICLQD